MINTRQGKIDNVISVQHEGKTKTSSINLYEWSGEERTLFLPAKQYKVMFLEQLIVCDLPVNRSHCSYMSKGLWYRSDYESSLLYFSFSSLFVFTRCAKRNGSVNRDVCIIKDYGECCCYCHWCQIIGVFNC